MPPIELSEEEQSYLAELVRKDLLARIKLSQSGMKYTVPTEAWEHELLDKLRRR